MSRLYTYTNTDMTKTTGTKRANQEARSKIHWGSKGDSKLAVEVIVSWPKGSDQPLVTVVYGDEVKIA